MTASWRKARTAGPRFGRDLGAVNDVLSPLFPGRLLLQDLHVAEIGLEAASTSRRSAPWPGSGVHRRSPDADRYAQRYAHCDVLVVGAGPAGIAAALAAEAHGARVILCDEQAELGGSLLAETKARDRRQAGLRLARRCRSRR